MADRGKTTDVLTEENVTFADLTISESTVHALEQAGFRKPSPIQLQALPLALIGLDLLIQAKSGTGKTLVFSITALESVQTNDDDDDEASVIGTRVIILGPTREIAQQIVQVIKTVKQPDCSVHTFIGGTALKDDQHHLKRCHIAVGTPGRIEELLRLRHLRADTIRLLILDEADALLCKEFQVTSDPSYRHHPSLALPAHQLEIPVLSGPNQFHLLLHAVEQTGAPRLGHLPRASRSFLRTLHARHDLRASRRRRIAQLARH